MPLARTVALAGLAAFVSLVTVQHLFRGDDLPPAAHFVSEYAKGPGGWVQVVAFLAWAVAFVASVALLWPERDRRPVARGLVALGFVAATAGAGLAAAFPTETVGGVLPEGAVKSPSGQLHDLGSAGIFFGLLVASIVSVRLIARRGYRLSVLGLGLLLFAVPAALIAAEYDAPGWGQRGFIAVGCLWHWRFVRAAAPPD